MGKKVKFNRKPAIKVGTKLFVLNVNTLKITETHVKNITNSEDAFGYFIGGYGAKTVMLNRYPSSIILQNLEDHLEYKGRKNPEFIGEQIFHSSELRVFIALTEKECYQHIINNVIPYKIIRKEVASKEIIKKYNQYMEEVGYLEKLAEKLKAEKL